MRTPTRSDAARLLADELAELLDRGEAILEMLVTVAVGEPPKMPVSLALNLWALDAAELGKVGRRILETVVPDGNVHVAPSSAGQVA
jgi:hypothetical protein